jgi:hypothetical protein
MKRIQLLVLLLAAPALAQDAHRHAPDERPVVPGERFLTSRANPLDLPLPEEQDAYFFVVFGDRTGGPPEGVQVLARAVADVNLLGPDLVMTVGDLVEGYNARPQWMEQMAEYKRIMDRLDCPWFPVAGNHDVYWRGDGKPPGEHEADFEAHFGPLWYAFRHKTAWFIVLYTDEGNAETGEKDFGKPECNAMSPEQLAWLEETLALTREAREVFVFCHHPRWLGGGYGDHWAKVHALLAAAGNVKAVFGGHIHRMRYDGVLDGIEYVTLATVGGHQSGLAPEAGYLHHYNVVTVRESGLGMTTYPVGAALDTRAITGALSDQARILAQGSWPRTEVQPSIGPEGFAVTDVFELAWTNPCDRPVEVTWTMGSRDARWVFVPDHHHAEVQPGEELRVAFRAGRSETRLDGHFHLARLSVQADYLAESLRVAMPLASAELSMPLIGATAPPQPAGESALACRGGGHALLPAGVPALAPDAPFSVEAWCRAGDSTGRRGLITRAESSEWGLFVSDGKPSFIVHLAGSYVTVGGTDALLARDRWQHVAGVFDGEELRLYVDGKLVASARGAGARTLNTLPLVIGGDVGADGSANSLYDGLLDEVRISAGARYAGDAVTPARRFEPDEATLLLLHMDGRLGPWLYDSSPSATHPLLKGAAAPVPAGD